MPSKRFIYDTLKPFRLLIIAQIMIGMFWAIDLSLRPYLLKTMIDKMSYIAPKNALAELWVPAAWYIFFALFIATSFRFYDYLWLKTNPPLKRHLGQVMMDRMMDHAHEVFQNNFAGSLGNKIRDVMSSVPDLIKLIIDRFITQLLAIFISTIAISMVSIKFALLFAGWITVFIVGSGLFASRATVLAVASSQVGSQVIGSIVDVLSNMMSVRLFIGKQAEKKGLTTVLDAYVQANQKRDWFLLKMFSFQGITFVIYETICLFWLIEGFSSSQVSAGDFALILSINFTMVESLWGLGKDIGHVSELAGNIAQGLKIVLSPHSIRDRPDAKALAVSVGRIEFSHVNFFYEAGKDIFHDLNVVIEGGQKVGLVGYSGSGKSTFVNLLLRIFDVASGAILIDGQNILDVTQASLRHAIGIIPQDPVLFHRSLYDNISYASPGVEEAKVVDASIRASAHDFIQKIPGRYLAKVGERGLKLSGGQRQRIAIARAVLKDAPILIMDEATSALDSVTEREIQSAFFSLMKNKTTLVIAHRLSTLKHMDRILVFDNGKIVEDGAHDDLIKKNGHYTELWQAQFEESLPSVRR